MTGLRIGVDATCWWNRRGFGRFTRLLLQSMFEQAGEHKFILFVDQEPVAEMQHPATEVVRVKTSATVTDSAVAEGNRKVTDMLAFYAAAGSQNLDVMYFPAVYSWFPTGGRVPTVVTFHDAIAEHYSGLVFPRLMGRVFWGLKTWLARKTATSLTTISQAAREEIVEYMKVPRDKIEVILEAADPIFKPIADLSIRKAVRDRYGLPDGRRMLLYVGGLAPHKNLLRLTDAFARAREDEAVEDMILVFVGDPKGDGFHSNYQEIKERSEASAVLSERIFFTGYVSDDDLIALYSEAHVVAMPALSEGFGLPAAEAIACGTPVIATAGGAVAEVVGRAGLFFDPLDVEDMARAIVRTAGDRGLYADLQAQCAARAAELSWATAAAAMITVLEQVGGG